jgi:ATP-dependent Clp protease adaptor protein ClpS
MNSNKYAMYGSKEKTIEQAEIAELEDTETNNHLIVWNDEVNTFEHVIDTLIEVCKHTKTQAEQCTMLIHYKGKCDVKKGSFTTLRPMAEAIIDRGIQATIE